MKIRQAKPADKYEWARMRNELWSSSISKHLQEIENYFFGKAPNIVEVFVLGESKKSLHGFIELNVRNYAEGSEELQTPYVEGWFIEKEIRGSGYGRQLITTAEAWAKSKGFKQLASDSELNNKGSIEAHKALGFKEVEKIVCFIKELN